MLRSERARRLTDELRGHDSKLYATSDWNGMIRIYRESVRLVPYHYDGTDYLVAQEAPHLIMALTDNWTVNGSVVDWGIEPVMQRIQEIDAWNAGQYFLENHFKRLEKNKESKARGRLNNAEGYLSDNAGAFRKAFSDINTSNLPKKDKRVF